MSWSSRLGGLVSGRFSPFARSTSDASAGDSSTVNASDYSYVTADDVGPTAPSRPGRGTDVLIFKHKRTHHPVHFPAGSISSSVLTLGDVRAAAAGKLGVSADRLRMYFRGKNFTPLPDATTAKQAGLKGDAQCEILCVVADAAPVVGADQEDEDEDDEADTPDEAVGAPASSGARKKRSKRGKKKSSRKSTGTSTPTSSALPEGGVALPSGLGNPPAAAAKSPPPPPLSPRAKLAAIAAHLHDELAPACVEFTTNPPADEAKREFEHKRLGESVLAQVILKLDGVEVADEEMRAKRRELVREAQGWLGRLDEVKR